MELISNHDPQTLFARLNSSGKDLGEGVMAGGAGEAYAILARRHNKSRWSIFEEPVSGKRNLQRATGPPVSARRNSDTAKKVAS